MNDLTVEDRWLQFGMRRSRGGYLVCMFCKAKAHAVLGSTKVYVIHKPECEFSKLYAGWETGNGKPLDAKGIKKGRESRD